MAVVCNTCKGACALMCVGIYMWCACSRVYALVLLRVYVLALVLVCVVVVCAGLCACAYA